VGRYDGDAALSLLAGLGIDCVILDPRYSDAQSRDGRVRPVEIRPFYRKLGAFAPSAASAALRQENSKPDPLPPSDRSGKSLRSATKWPPVGGHAGSGELKWVPVRV